MSETTEEVKVKPNRAETEEIVKQNTQTHSPADQAAAHFQLKYPHFKNSLKTLKKRELERVLLNLVAGPLVPKENQLKGEYEKKVWYLGEELIQALTIMRIEMEMQRMEHTHKEELETIKEGEKTNGEI